MAPENRPLRPYTWEEWQDLLTIVKDTNFGAILSTALVGSPKELWSLNFEMYRELRYIRPEWRKYGELVFTEFDNLLLYVNGNETTRLILQWRFRMGK
jgi:hypothetical protein